jgi:hypothetical protein
MLGKVIARVGRVEASGDCCASRPERVAADPEQTGDPVRRVPQQQHCHDPAIALIDAVRKFGERVRHQGRKDLFSGADMRQCLGQPFGAGLKVEHTVTAGDQRGTRQPGVDHGAIDEHRRRFQDSLEAMRQPESLAAAECR